MDHQNDIPTIEATPVENTHRPAPRPDLLEVAPGLNPQQESLNQLLASRNYRVKEERSLVHRRTVEPAESQTEAVQCSTNSAPLFSAPTAPALRRRLRLGKIARLPKAERDMVNRLLLNNVPYSRIVWALSERHITVTERNISNWRVSGGYDEWRAEQDNQVRLGQIQDHVLDYLRKNDGHQIAEVGLQVAATQLTTALMNPELSRKLLADPKQFKEVVGTLSQCSNQLIQFDEKRRDSVRKAGHRGSADNIRWEDQQEIDCIREIAEAEEMAQSDLESHLPHRNALPPRETLPVDPPGPTMGEQLGLVKRRPSKRHFLIQNALACGVDKPAPRNPGKRLGAPQRSPKQTPPSPATTDQSKTENRHSQMPSTDAYGSLQTLTEGLPAAPKPIPAIASALGDQSKIENLHSQIPRTDAYGSLQTLTEGLPPAPQPAMPAIASAPSAQSEIENLHSQIPRIDANGSLRTLTEGLPSTPEPAMPAIAPAPSPQSKIENRHSQIPRADAYGSLQTLTEGLPAVPKPIPATTAATAPPRDPEISIQTARNHEPTNSDAS
jgi:hypothetical protein